MITNTNYLFALLVGLLFWSCSNNATTTEATDDAGDQTETTAEPESTIIGAEMTYSTDTTNMIGYLVYDGAVSEKRPGILVVHEWWGHNDYTRMRADMLAELGYVALAVDMYGDGQLADHPQDAGKFARSVLGNFPTAEARFRAAIETLKADPRVDVESIGAIGYCFGGGVVLSMANTGMEDLDAVASFHGSVALPVMPEEGKVNTRVLVCNGADDPFVTQEQIDAYTAAMDAAGADYEFVNYAGVKHSFTNKEADANGEKFDMPLAYDQAADEQSWEKMKQMFAEVFGRE